MDNEVVSVLKTALRSWVCKKDALSKPALLTEPDIHDLAVATKAGMVPPPCPEGVREWGNLRELTKGWIVQQEPDAIPEALQNRDFEYLATLIAPSCSDAQPLHEDEKLVFAREHLERCL